MSEELSTQAWLVKTPEDQDAVIVSFVDDGEVTGIYLFEPGADPVELDAVRFSGTASEFEYATVEVSPAGSDSVHDLEFRGDEMVTLADSDARVSAAVENRDSLRQAHDALREQTQALIDSVQEKHDDLHIGAFQWCPEPMCEAARAVEL